MPWPDLSLDAPEADWPRPDAGTAIVLGLDLRDLGWRDEAVRDAPTPTTIARLQPLLDPTEQARAARFVFVRDRWRHVASHAVLRRVLGRHLGHPREAPHERLVSAVRYRIAEDGKPGLAGPNPTDLRFNLSHSGPWVLIGAICGVDLGVDVEAHGPVPNLAALADAHFSDDECVALAQVPADERPAAFHRVWTRKEAYVKALGMGLATPLHRFTVSLAAGDSQALLRLDARGARPSDWTVCDLPGIESAAAALAAAAPRIAVRRHRLALPAPSAP